MLRPLIAAALVIFSSSALARQVVNVSGVYFPPYAFGASEVANRGLLPELTSALNSQQSEFEFIIVPTSLQRRYADLKNGRVDISLFENPRWGWQDVPSQSVDMGLEDAEVFVARSAQGRYQTYFDKILGKRLALFSGYHYGFAGFNTDAGYLAKMHNAIVSRSLDGNIMMVLHRRADIALVTRSYVKVFIEAHPKYANSLLVSERLDQIYAHHAILRNNAPVSAQRFHQLLEGLRQSGQLDAIFAPYSIKVMHPGKIMVQPAQNPAEQVGLLRAKSPAHP